MRDDRLERRTERDALKLHTTKTVRFAAVVKAAGTPEVYLPLFDPKRDRAFMSAVKENRVLSIRQEPTSKRTDFGIVGFDEHKHTTLLVFPKPLTRFIDARVIGIKYSMLGESSISASPPPKSSKVPKSRRTTPDRAAKVWPSPSTTEHTTKRKHASKSLVKAPMKPGLQPKEFRVRLRITTVSERDVAVKARTKDEARKRAADSIEGGTVKVLTVEEA